MKKTPMKMWLPQISSLGKSHLPIHNCIDIKLYAAKMRKIPPVQGNQQMRDSEPAAPAAAG
jgi:hypothetical protein